MLIGLQTWLRSQPQPHNLYSYGGVDAIAFSPDGKQLVVAGRDGVVSWDTTTGKRLHRFNSHDRADAIAFSPDGKQLVVAGRDGVVLWDTTIGKRLHRFDSYNRIDAIAFSPDGKQLVVAGRDRVVLWDTTPSKRLHRLDSYDRIDAIAFSPDGKQLAVAGRDGVVSWDTTIGKRLHRFDSYDRIDAIAFSPDGKQLAVVGRDRVVSWDTTTGKRLHRFNSHDRADAIAFSPDGKQLAVAGRDGVVSWDTTIGKRLHRFDSYNRIDAIAFSPDGKQLAVVGRDGVVSWDTTTGKQLHTFYSYGGADAIAFSPDGKQLAVAGRDGVVSWDTTTGKRLHTFYSYGGVDAIAFSPDGEQLAVVGRDGVVLWDTTTGKRLHEFDGYGGADAIAFSPDGKQLVSASTDQTTSWNVSAPMLAKSKLSGKKNVSYNLDETKDIREVQVLYDTYRPMAQVQDALSYLGEGQHTVVVNADWQLPEYVRDGLDRPQDLAAVLTITGEIEQAYACPCEDYVRFAWGENISILEFFRAFVASGFAAKARKYPLFNAKRQIAAYTVSAEVSPFLFRWSQPTVSAEAESSVSADGSETLTFRVTAERDCLVGICQCILWLAAVCRPPEQGSVRASSAAFEKESGDKFAIRTEPLRPLPSPGSKNLVGGCWIHMFDGGYVLAQGFPVPVRKSGSGIESSFNMMIEQAMTYHTISYGESIILKGRHTALVPILVEAIGALEQSKEVQWHLIGKKPKLVQVEVREESKRLEGYYLTDVEFTTEEPDLSWETIDQEGLRMLPVRSVQEFSGKRMFVGHFPRAQVLPGAKEAGYGNVELSNAISVKGNVVDFGETINFAMGTNFGTAGMLNMTGSTTIRRSRYDSTPKQVPALIGDMLRNRRSKPHILYDVEQKTAWMIPEACVILYLMHRWASLQKPLSFTDNQLEVPGELSSQYSGPDQPSSSRQEDSLGSRESSLLEYMPFSGASCDSGKKAADVILNKFSQFQVLPTSIRSIEKPEKPVYVANIIARMYFIIESLIEHQKCKKPGFLKRYGDHPCMWGYELADVAGLNKAEAKEVHIDQSHSGGWYNLTEPKSEIVIIFGQKFGNLIQYEPGQTLCHYWKTVPTGNYFLSAESETLNNFLGQYGRSGFSKLYLSSKHSGIKNSEPQKCEGKNWPCCNIALQLEPMAPALTTEIKDGRAVVIGKAVTKLQKPAEEDAGKEHPDTLHSKTFKRRSTNFLTRLRNKLL